MSVKNAGGPAPEVLQVRLPEARRGTLKALGGSSDDDFNNVLANQVVQALWLANSDKDERGRQMQAAVSAMFGVQPGDELEGMLGAQMIATHNAALECFRRAMLKEQTFGGAAREPEPGEPAGPLLRGAARGARQAQGQGTAGRPRRARHGRGRRAGDRGGREPGGRGWARNRRTIPCKGAGPCT